MTGVRLCSVTWFIHNSRFTVKSMYEEILIVPIIIQKVFTVRAVFKMILKDDDDS